MWLKLTVIWADVFRLQAHPKLDSLFNSLIDDNCAPCALSVVVIKLLRPQQTKIPTPNLVKQDMQSWIYSEPVFW